MPQFLILLSAETSEAKKAGISSWPMRQGTQQLGGTDVLVLVHCLTPPSMSSSTFTASMLWFLLPIQPYLFRHWSSRLQEQYGISEIPIVHLVLERNSLASVVWREMRLPGRSWVQVLGGTAFKGEWTTISGTLGQIYWSIRGFVSCASAGFMAFFLPSKCHW